MFGCEWGSNSTNYGSFADFVYSCFEGGSEAVTGTVKGGGRMYAVKVLRASGGLGSRNPAVDPYQQVNLLELSSLPASHSNIRDCGES